MSLFKQKKENGALIAVRAAFLAIMLVTSAAMSCVLTKSSLAGVHGNLSHFELNVTDVRIDDSEMEPDTLFVIDFVLARDVVEREPVDIVRSYSMDDSRAWCFARIHNSQMMQSIFFEWYYEDELYFEMNTRIGVSANWRTYSSVSLQPGRWRVVLKDRHGDILDQIRFDVTE